MALLTEEKFNKTKMDNPSHRVLLLRKVLRPDRQFLQRILFQTSKLNKNKMINLIRVLSNIMDWLNKVMAIQDLSNMPMLNKENKNNNNNKNLNIRVLRNKMLILIKITKVMLKRDSHLQALPNSS
jgi:hypothetical protein